MSCVGMGAKSYSQFKGIILCVQSDPNQQKAISSLDDGIHPIAKTLQGRRI
jgi:hypothetical protein